MFGVFFAVILVKLLVFLDENTDGVGLCSELVYTVVNELLATLYYLIGLKSHLLITQFPQI